MKAIVLLISPILLVEGSLAHVRIKFSEDGREELFLVKNLGEDVLVGSEVDVIEKTDGVGSITLANPIQQELPI